MDATTVTIAGVGTLITALVAAYVALQKLRPDTATVFVSAAESLVITQSTVLQETREANEALRLRLDTLEADQRTQSAVLEEQREHIVELHDELRSMHQELSSLTQSRDQARRELKEARSEVELLRARVLLLEQQLESHGLPIPSVDDLDGGVGT